MLTCYYIQCTGWTQKSSPLWLLLIFQPWVQIFAWNFTWLKWSNIHFITKFGWNMLENDKIMLFQPRQPTFLSVRASCRTDWMRTGSLRRLSGPQALHIWTHWTVTSGALCWKSIINSSQSIRQLMSWKSLCRPFPEEMPREHVNKAVAIFTKCPTAYVALAAWWSLRASAITVYICKSASSSHHQQTGSFQWH